MPGDSRSAEEPIAVMNVIPFIDICLVLLIVVLVTASFSTALLGFTHPLAEKTEYLESSQAVRVEVAADGRCTINGKPVPVENLRAEAAAFVSRPFVVAAGSGVQAQYVIKAVEQLKAAGNVRLTFLAVSR
jgi:biopolymer transport protein ExbD